MIAEAFAEIVCLAERLGVQGINALPGCLEHHVSDGWWIALNGHREPIKCSKGAEVPPFTAYVEWHGWPAGFVNPSGGTIVAGDAANEGALIEALKVCAQEGGG